MGMANITGTVVKVFQTPGNQHNNNSDDALYIATTVYYISACQYWILYIDYKLQSLPCSMKACGLQQKKSPDFKQTTTHQLCH